MKVTHNKNNDWREELAKIDHEYMIPFVESVIEEVIADMQWSVDNINIGYDWIKNLDTTDWV